MADAADDLATLGVIVSGDGVEETGASLDKLAESGAKAETQAKATATAHIALGSALNSAKTAVDANVTSGTTFAQNLLDMGNNAKSTTNSATGLAQAAVDLANKLNLNNDQFTELLHSGRAVFDNLADGQNVFRAFREEVPRVAETLGLGSGGLAGVLSAVSAFINPVTIGIAAIGGVVIATGVAALQYNDNLRTATNTSVELGRMSEATGQQIADMSDNVAASGVSVGAARTSIEAFTSAGAASNETVQLLASTVNDYSELTGIKAADANKTLALAISDPIEASKELNAQLGFLSPALMEQIQNLQESGDKAGAASILVKAFAEDQKAAAAAADIHTGALKSLVNGISQVWDWLGKTSDRLITGAVQWTAYYAAKNAGIDEQSPDQKAASNAIDQANLKNKAELNTTLGAGNAVNLQYDITGSAGKQQIQNQLTAVQNAQNATPLNSAAYKDDATQIDALTRAINTYVPAAQKALDVETAQAKLHAINPKDKADMAAAQAALVYANAEGQVINPTTLAAQATEARTAALTKFKAAAEDGQKEIIEHIAKLGAEVAGQQALNDAYVGGEGAVLKATAAEAAATDQAGKKYTAQQKQADNLLQLELATEKYTGTVDKAAASEEEKASVTKSVADGVANGTIAYSDANDEITKQNTLLPINQALALAANDTTVQGVKNYQALQAALAATTKAINDQKVAQGELAIVTDTAKTNDATKLIEAQTAAIGLNNTAQAEAIAEAKALQVLSNTPGAPTADSAQGQAYIASQTAQAAAQVQLKNAQDAYNTSLSKTYDYLQLIQSATSDAASALSTGFGNAGKAIGDASNALASYAATGQKNYDDLQKAEKQYSSGSATDIAALADANQKYSQQTQANTDKMYGSMIDSAKEFFTAGSTGYQVLTVVEGAYRAVQLANSVAAVAQSLLETQAEVAAATAQGSAWGVAAFARSLASLPFPENLAAGAAVIAALLAVGVALGGGAPAATGGTTAPSPSAAAQAAQGVGTAGDNLTQSKSISDSISNTEKYQNSQLDYSNQMLTQLQNVNTNIGALTTTLGDSISLTGGALDTSSVKTGTSSSSSLFGLLTDTTATSVADNGLTFAVQNLTDVLKNGIQGSSYIETQKTTTSSGFFGIGGGTSTKDSTATTALDSTVDSQITDVISSIQGTILAASKTLGQTGAAAALAEFQVDIGKISFAGMSESQIQDTLNAVFSKLGDQMAAQADGLIVQFGKAGEGALETLTRVATDFSDVNDQLRLEGIANQSFNSIGGVDSIAAHENLVNLAGSLDTFNTQAEYFTQNFLTAAQQLAPIQSAVSTEMASLGLSSVTTTAQFASVVQGLDLSTTAGQQLYSSLMAVAPAFNTVAAAATSLKSAQDQIQEQIYTAQGNTGAATALDRADSVQGLDPSLVALNQQLWALQDAATAASAASSLQVTLLQDTGQAISATNIQRQAELAGESASLQGTQEAIYAAEDLTTANTAAMAASTAAAAALTTATSSVTSAQSELTSAYQTQETALQSTITEFDNFVTSLEAFQKTLSTGDDAGLSPQDEYTATQAQFQQDEKGAAAGDPTALANIQGDSQSFLDASKAYYGSSASYQNDLKTVEQAITQATNAAKGQESAAQQQLNDLTNQVSQLVDLNSNVKTVADAIADLNAATAAQSTAKATADAAAAINTQALLQQVLDALNASLGQQSAISAANQAQLAALAASLDKANRLAQQTSGS